MLCTCAYQHAYVVIFDATHRPVGHTKNPAKGRPNQSMSGPPRRYSKSAPTELDCSSRRRLLEAARHTWPSLRIAARQTRTNSKAHQQQHHSKADRWSHKQHKSMPTTMQPIIKPTHRNNSRPTYRNNNWPTPAAIQQSCSKEKVLQ